MTHTACTWQDAFACGEIDLGQIVTRAYQHSVVNTDARNGAQLGCFRGDLLGHLDNLRSRLRTVRPQCSTTSKYLAAARRLTSAAQPIGNNCKFRGQVSRQSTKNRPNEALDFLFRFDLL